MATVAPARPQRASALAAKKRVTDFAAKQQKDMEVLQMHAAICCPSKVQYALWCVLNQMLVLRRTKIPPAFLVCLARVDWRLRTCSLLTHLMNLMLLSRMNIQTLMG